jgi:predicted patatin/cPLA2 family phospholipase
MHPVIELIKARAASNSRPGERDDGARLALVVEGGGMRAAVTAAMLCALDARGLAPTLDAVYGTSAGAIGGAWLLSGAAHVGKLHWTRRDLRLAAIGRRNVLRGRPLVDGRHLLENVYEGAHPMPFGRILASPIQLHPVATDAATAAPTDLAPLIHDIPSLKLALRASMALPLLAGPPVALAGKRFFDGGIAEAVPYRSAIADGATHILVLRSRRANEHHTDDSGRTGRLAERYLRRYSHELAAAFTQRPQRLIDDDDELATREHNPAAGPELLSLRPAPDTPAIKRLEPDQAPIITGMRAGDHAVATVFARRPPRAPKIAAPALARTTISAPLGAERRPMASESSPGTTSPRTCSSCRTRALPALSRQ